METRCDPDKLAALARKGDLAALDLLTRCQGERLLAIGRRHCRTEDDARDAVQDALVSAATHLPTYRGEGAVDAWVIRMVARACGRMRRGRKNDSALHGVDVDVASEDESPEVLAGRARIAEALGQALLSLEPLDRAILLLAEAEGMTGPEIADRVGLAATAVRARLSRARKRLRVHLEPFVGVS